MTKQQADEIIALLKELIAAQKGQIRYQPVGVLNGNMPDLSWKCPRCGRSDNHVCC